MIAVSIALFYALMERKKYESWKYTSDPLIIKQLPAFSIKSIDGTREIGHEELQSKFAKGFFVHFWGTWCAPCIPEIPELISFAKLYENKQVGFFIVAIRDEEKEINKFLQRFRSTLPDNIVLAHDKEGDILNDFGTVKLPETYLFRADGTALKKYVGAQDWNHPSYKDQVNLTLTVEGSAGL